MKQISSVLLSLVLVLAMLPSTAFATEITTAGGTNEVPVELTQEATAFSVTVPTVLPVDVDATGVVTVATDNKIINNSYGPVEVKGVEVQPIDPWKLVDFTTDFTQKKVGLSEFGFQLNGTNVETDGSCEAEFAVIDGNSEIGFTYDANVAAQKAALEDVQIAQVVFTMGWSSTGASDDTDNTTSLEAGLYDANGVMLCSWEDSGIDIETNYTTSNYNTATTSGYYVLTNNYPTTTQVIIPDGVNIIGDIAFADCLNLISVTIPDSVTSIGEYAFANCSSLTEIIIPDSVTSIGNYAFWYCSNLTAITIPDSVTSIGKHAIDGCSSLTEITIPDSVTNIGSNAFQDCSSLTAINVDTNNTAYCSVDGVMYKKDMRTLVRCPEGKADTPFDIPDGVTSIRDDAFLNCSSLTAITIPDSVTSIGESAFANCSSLTEITIPDSVTSIGEWAFYICSSLAEITIPDSVTSIGPRIFYNCSSLTAITIPDSVTSIGTYAFFGCTKLANIYYTGTEDQWDAIRFETKWNLNAGSDTTNGTYTITYNYAG